MSYTTENFMITATDEVTPVLNRAAVAAGNAGVKLTAFGETLRQGTESAARFAAAGGNVSGSLGTVAQSAQRSGKELHALREELKAVGANAGQTGKAAGGMLGTAANGVIALSGAVAGIRTAIQAVAKPFREAFRFENVATRLAPVLGGLDKSRAMAEHLRKEAANGTMSFEQLASVAGRLGAVFSSTENIQTWTSAFHNLSAATGMDINELVGNFVKMKAAGRVTGEFPEMFAQKGVNIFGELEKQTGKSAAELRKMATAGTLSFSEIETALLSLTTGTGKFATIAAEMSNNAGGSVATLAAEWDIFLAKLARPVAVALTPAVQLLSRVISAVGDGAQTLPGKIGTGLLAAGAAVGVCVKAWKALSSSIRGAIIAVRAFGRASTAALISSGVGIALVALGTAYEFFASKKDELEAEAAKAEAEAAKAKDKAAQAERERKARAAREREELEREAQKARADREKSLERAESIRNEFEKAQHAILRANALASEKVKAELQIVGLETVEDLKRELGYLSSKTVLSLDGLTEEQAARARELLAVQKNIEQIEMRRQAASRSLGERVFLLEAELKGAEALAAAKEKIYRNTLRQKVAEAAPQGTSVEAIESKVNEILDLEKAVDEKRKSDTLVETMEKESERLNLKRAKASGNAELYEQLEQYYREKHKIDELVGKGYSRPDAEAAAREESTLDAVIAGKKIPGRNVSLPAAIPPPQTTEPILPATLLPGMKTAADNSLAAAARATASNTAGILAELRKRPQTVAVPALLS